MKRFDIAGISPSRLVIAWPLLILALMVATAAAAVYAIRLSEVPESAMLPLSRPPSPAVSPSSRALGDALAVETFLPQQKLDLAPTDAFARNLARPLTRLNPAPPVFSADWLSPKDLAIATECLTTAIYYEANGEPTTGQLAVAQVVLNRVRHPRYPKTVCGVVYQGSERATGCQFSFTCDGSLRRRPDPARWKKVQAVAEAALHGTVSYLAGQATHYHTLWIVPVWAPELAKVAIVNNHVFYRPVAPYGPYDMAPAAPKPPDLNAGPPGSAVTAQPNNIVAPRATEQARLPAADASGTAGSVPSVKMDIGDLPPRQPSTSPTPITNPYFRRPVRRKSNLAIPSS